MGKYSKAIEEMARLWGGRLFNKAVERSARFGCLER